MFRGFEFAIPAIFATLFTLAIGGGICVFSWIVVSMERRSDANAQRLSPALYAYTASVLVILVGWMTVASIPYGWEHYRIAGERVQPAIYSVFLAVSFVGMILTTSLQRGRGGSIKGLLLIGSFSVIACDLMALAVFLVSRG